MGMAASRTAGRELGIPNGRVYHQVRLRDDPGHRPAREAVDHQRPRPLHGRGENQEAHRLPDRLGHAGPGQVPGGRPVPVRPRVGAMRVPAAARPQGTRAALRGDSRRERPRGQRGQGAQGRRARCRGPALGDDQGQAEDQAGVDAGRRVRGASGPDARLRGRRLGLASLEAAALRLPAAARDRLGREDEGRQAARDVGRTPTGSRPCASGTGWTSWPSGATSRPRPRTSRGRAARGATARGRRVPRGGGRTSTRSRG